MLIFLVKGKEKMSNRIKKLRLEKKISQQKLANEVGVTRQAISLFEKGERDPKLETWIKLAGYFNVSIPYLQGISKNKSSGKSFSKKGYYTDYWINQKKNIPKDKDNMMVEMSAYLDQLDLNTFEELVSFFELAGRSENLSDKAKKLLNTIDDLKEIGYILDSTFYFFESYIEGLSGDKDKLKLVKKFDDDFMKLYEKRFDQK